VATALPPLPQTNPYTYREGAHMNKNAKQWDESSFLAKLKSLEGPDVENITKKILEWARTNEFEIKWGEGDKQGGVQIQYNGNSLISLKISGKVTIWFNRLRNFTDQFKKRKIREELHNKLNDIKGVKIPKKDIDEIFEPGIPLSVFINDASLKKFLKIINLIRLELKNGENSLDGLDDTFDDMPGLDFSLIGSDGAPIMNAMKSYTKRDPRVRRVVLKRAKGKCEREECQATRDYSGFLDVHHILKVEKSDRVWNCVALCPNCHREAHVAPNRDQINKKLLAFAKKFRNIS
jgi:hypothetical protein